MPSPIGHVLAGVAVSLAIPEPSDPPARVNWTRAGFCAFVAALPDIDQIYMPSHRTLTHSVPVAILVTVIAVIVTGWLNRSRGKPTAWGRVTWRTGLVLGLAWSSHMLLDALAADAFPPYGIQLFWPFSDDWYFSGWNIFPVTERRDLFGSTAVLINAKAALTELAVMGPIAAAMWALRASWVKLFSNSR